MQIVFSEQQFKELLSLFNKRAAEVRRAQVAISKGHTVLADRILQRVGDALEFAAKNTKAV